MKQRQHSRIAPVVVALLALTACGGADDSADTPLDTPTEQPSGTTEPDSGLRAPTPIEMVGGASGGSDGRLSAEAAPSADSATSDMMIAQFIAEYVVGDGMPALPTDDTGYVFDATVAVTAEQVAAIAAALGVEGEPVRIDEGYGVSWRVGPDDGSAASLWVNDDGQQYWNYSAPWDRNGVAEACAVSVDTDGVQTEECPEPVPPIGVPTADVAQQRATDLLAALGVDVSSLTFETYADEWFASVDASDRSDERAAIRTWNFGFGAEGVMQYAGGTLAAAVPVGPYPLVDLDTAVARLSDGFHGGFYGGYGGIAIDEPALAVDAGVATDGVAVEGDPGQTEPVAVDPVADPMPVEPMPDPEPVVITLVDVQPDLWWAYDADGSAWLLPAYRFIDTDGGWHVVPAVTDEFLIQADPVLIDEPLPTPEPMPAPEPAPAPDSTPAPTDTVEPGTDPAAATAALDEFVGLSIEEFTDQAKALGFETRIVQQDGEPLMVTDDYRTDRVNVVVEGPRVIAIDSIG